jgi:transcriptional regulator with XRE-family HTH domain
MKSLHTELKETRLQKGISLEDIYRETKIRTSFIQRMEEGDFSIVPEPFIRAFLREYAEVVGLDPNRVIEKYEGKSVSLREEPPQLENIQPFTPHVHTHSGTPPSVSQPDNTTPVSRRSSTVKPNARPKSAYPACAHTRGDPANRGANDASAHPEIPASEGTGEHVSPAPSPEPPKTRITVTIDETVKPEGEVRDTGPLFPEEEPRTSRTIIFGMFILLIIIATLAILFINGKLSF